MAPKSKKTGIHGFGNVAERTTAAKITPTKQNNKRKTGIHSLGEVLDRAEASKKVWDRLELIHKRNDRTGATEDSYQAKVGYISDSDSDDNFDKSELKRDAEVLRKENEAREDSITERERKLRQDADGLLLRSRTSGYTLSGDTVGGGKPNMKSLKDKNDSAASEELRKEETIIFANDTLHRVRGEIYVADMHVVTGKIVKWTGSTSEIGGRKGKVVEFLGGEEAAQYEKLIEEEIEKLFPSSLFPQGGKDEESGQGNDYMEAGET
ncbi:MAG: hypothetical protein Q9165_001345 [Trypethelium subeluteriae]